MDDEFAHIRKLLDETRSLLPPPVNAVGNSQIVVHAGGIGVWISATAAAVCFAAVIVLTMLYIDQSRRIDDLGDYLAAIYMQAPHLKPPEKTE
jgi:hypothetical protein